MASRCAGETTRRLGARTLGLAVAIALASASPSPAQETALDVVIDPDITVGAGATIAVTAGDLLVRAGDAVLPHRLFAERGAARRAANIGFRALKLAYLDVPREQLLLVVNHEVFGHGARLRELFDGRVAYDIHVPPPYGRGGGSTTFTFDREPTTAERLAVHGGGMEADAVAASIISERAFVDRRIDPRTALRYLAFELDTLSYIWSTDDEGEEPGHDGADFIATYNEAARTAGTRGLSARSLRRQALIGLANPMLGFAVYGLARYISTGATAAPVPALPIAGVRVLPLVRYRLTSFGTEWAAVTALSGRIRPTEIELRIGRSPGATPWGLGVRQRTIATWGEWIVDASGNVWQQPRITAASSAARNLRIGGSVGMRAARPLIPTWFSPARVAVLIDVAVKSEGFLQGEPLDAGAVVRAGIAVPVGRR